MLQVTENEIKNRLALENPWWRDGDSEKWLEGLPKRAYFQAFLSLVKQKRPHRAVVLMGPRRVGKTVMITQAIDRLVKEAVPPKRILYVSVDTPTYTGLTLERLLNLFLETHKHNHQTELFVFFDEIQYHTDWERHLKSLVDSYPEIRFVASGSAAAALRMKSQESGAGRFTDFLLPPLSFAEFLRFLDIDTAVIGRTDDPYSYRSIEQLNAAFIDYINFGGFPEAVLQEEVRKGMDRFIANDIIDKVLLRDLPSLYGIGDTQELKQLFSVLAYNTGQEVTFDGLSKASGVAKNTLKKYLDFLEAAFLIHRLHRIDQTAHRFKRITHFKVYLTNVCIRAALFGTVTADDENIGAIVESAHVAQLIQSILSESLHYARWANGEVDLVRLRARDQSVSLAEEVKWSDRVLDRPEELKSLVAFCKSNGLSEAHVLTRSVNDTRIVQGITIRFAPVSAITYVAAMTILEEPLKAGLDPKTGRKLLSLA